MTTIEELQQQRTTTLERAKAVVAQAKAAGRDILTPAEHTEVTEVVDRVDLLDRQIRDRALTSSVLGLTNADDEATRLGGTTSKVFDAEASKGLVAAIRTRERKAVILGGAYCEVYIVSMLPPLDTVEAGSTVRRSRDESFEVFYLQEYPRLLALARGLVGAVHAEDVAQDAMLVACRRWREVSQKQRPDLWVRRVCSNMAVSTFRRRIRDARTVARLSAGRSEAVLMPGASEEFWSAVRTLPARQAQAAALRFVYDMPIAEIAATMQCSPGAVKQHLSRARKALGRALATGKEGS